MNLTNVPKIQAQNLTKKFGDKVVLENLNLSVQKGETQVIIGGSGSGKSVLLKCILGLLTPTDGCILIDGERTTHLKRKERYELMKKFGVLFQSGALFDSLSVWENVAFGLLQQNVKRKEAREIAINKLALVGLKPEVTDKNPNDLSGGMRKRVGLARAICLEPEIIFYDEPTTGLDPITTDVINDLILKLQEELNVTSLVITHDMRSAFKIADTISMLYHGRFIAKGTPEEIQNSEEPHVKQFINGSSDGPIKMTVSRNLG